MYTKVTKTIYMIIFIDLNMLKKGAWVLKTVKVNLSDSDERQILCLKIL